MRETVQNLLKLSSPLSEIKLLTESEDGNWTSEELVGAFNRLST